MKKAQIFVMLGTTTLVLAGCSSADEKPRRGKYKTEVQLTALEMPGMPPAMKPTVEQQLKSQFAQQVGADQCIGGTQKDEWKTISKDISKGMGSSCKTVRDASTDTTVDLQVQCSDPQKGQMTATIKGAAESESFGLDINMDMNMGAPGKGKMGMKITGTRTGDC
jgi:Protein of unknown function (DUF3617)